MVISLDNEISQFEPFGRSVITSVPEHKIREANNDDPEDIVALAHHLHNDFITAELNSTRDLYRSFNDVSISTDVSSVQEFWKVRKCAKGEEELYVNDNTVICSFKQSNNNATSVLNKTFTFNEKIIDATWCNFITNDSINGIASQELSNLMFTQSTEAGSNQYPKFSLYSPKNEASTLPPTNIYNRCHFTRNVNIARSLCVLDKFSIHILPENGDNFRKALQFEVNKIVPTNFCLLLERTVNEKEKLDKTSPPFPLLFSLSNPLNEIVPVLINTNNANAKQISNQNIGYVTRIEEFTLVDFIAEKNFAIFYCAKTSSHHIYYLRSVNNAELDWIRQDLEKPMEENMDVDTNLNTSGIGSALNTSANLVSTPISSLANGENTKKQYRLSYAPGTSSPITRSMANNLYSNLVQTSNNPIRQSPRTSIGHGTLNITSSRHSLSNVLTGKRSFSPAKTSPMILSRIESPVSPNLNRLTFSSANLRQGGLMETDPEMRFNLQFPNTAKAESLTKSGQSANIATPTVIRSSDMNVEQKFSEPIIAEFSLEYVWSEPKITPSQLDANCAASKVFVTCDFLGQNYLCLLIHQSKDLIQSEMNSSSVLKLIKFEQITDDDSELNLTRYIFGATQVLNVKDAEPIEALNMIIVLDETNALILYSGIYKVSIIHLQSGPHLSSGLTENFDCKMVTPNFKKILQTKCGSPSFDLDLTDFLNDNPSKSKTNKIQASSPIVSNLNADSLNLSSNSLSKPLDDSLLAFSIQQYPAFGQIITVRDSINNRVTFETSDSKFYRISFPQMVSTFLVDKCLAALRQTFPKEVAINFITSWYTFRNSTNKDENIPEINLFKLCLLSLIGYDKDSIKEDYIFKNEISSAVLPSSINAKSVVVSSPHSIGHSETLEKEIIKKMKIEDDNGSDDDWFALCRNSTNLHGLNKTKLLDDINIPKHASTKSKPKRTTRSAAKLSSQCSDGGGSSLPKSQYQFTCPSMLFPYTPNILYSLHLIYEDLKLVQMNWPLCKSIVDVLYLLAVDLNLPYFQDHYLRDFPSICAEITTNCERYKADQRTKLIYPSYFCERPPSILSALYSLLKLSEQDKKNQTESVYFPYIGNGGSVPKSVATRGAHIITPNIFNLVLLYSNLNQEELVDPQQTLQCIGNNLFLNISPSSAYINLAKFRQIVQLYSNNQTFKDSYLNSLYDIRVERQSLLDPNAPQSIVKRDSREKILFLLSALSITQEYIKELPFGLALPIWHIIYGYRMNPKNDWSSSIYSLIDRPDLLSLEFQESFPQALNHSSSNEDEAGHAAEDEENELAYLDYSVLRLLFPNDQRLQEAYQMLISTKPMTINIQQGHGVNDHDFVEEQERHLSSLCIRQMALTLGRGMVTLRSYIPVVAERFPIPSLCLTGKAPPRNTVIELSHIDVPPNMNVWPLFHNGVSAGLRISSHLNKMVDSSWILFNKPANNTTSEEHYAHAGFLLALGLNGLLDNLSIMDLHEYLSKGNDLTKVSILLGLAASRRGTMDPNAYILLGIHLEGLLPSTSTELDVSPIVKVAAVLGVGLIFQGTGHSYIAEVMLNEIGRPPGPEMEHYIDRESYALSAGLAFGLVTLGRGNEMISMVSSEGISIPDQLNHYMLGVHKKQATLQKEKNKTPSYHIREGDCINADVTSPGATLALGMMFFNTGNKAISQWLDVPDTQNLLEMVRPDFILLRVLAKNLIMWDSIKPTSAWIESHIPAIIYKNAFQKVASTTRLHVNEVMQEDIDYETMTQSYCNIIAGACFALALRYAGSADPEAFEVVKKNTVKLITVFQKATTAHIEQAGRSTIESCVNVLIVSCAIIMAGTGNVDVMRLCRFLRSRVTQSHVLYGSFMAIHMALGLLFLGGCRITLNSSPESVAALICAFFPKYPIHTYDNRYHLQAFRHLYVLATEPRLLIPRCINTGTPVYAKLLYRFKAECGKPTRTIEKWAPCILPDLNLLESVQLIDSNYWNISFDCYTNFNKLRKCLQYNGNLYIKRKVKSLGYNKEFIYTSSDEGDASQSFKSFFSKFSRKSFTLFDFTNEMIMKTFSDIFITNNLNNEHNLAAKNKLISILYDCAENEALELFGPLIKLIAACTKMLEQKQKEQLSSGTHSVAKYDNQLGELYSHKYFTIWQIKFAAFFLSKAKNKAPQYKYLETLRFQLEQIIKNSVNRDEIQRYLNGQLSLKESSESLIDTVVYYDLPPNSLKLDKEIRFLELLKMLRSDCSVSTGAALFVYKLLKN